MTAPTNHAADVIAEQLLNSGKYHPGEFIRFNGFMRSEQVIVPAIKEFCVDGEFLDSVARHRLIVATCATAGQFFTLNLQPGHFTHVFIDEAGYCTEPESMISAVNLDITKGGQVNPIFALLLSQNMYLMNNCLQLSLADSCWRSQPTWPSFNERYRSEFTIELVISRTSNEREDGNQQYLCHQQGKVWNRQLRI